MVDDPFGDIQRAYWQVNGSEKAALMARYPDDLSWPELLRLHHLNCMELVSDGSGQEALHGEGKITMLVGEAASLCRELIDRLVTPESPYRPRQCAVWQNRPNETSQGEREPEMQGLFSNASYTHIGAVEFIRLVRSGNEYEPTEIGFAALDDVRAIGFGARSLYRPARIFYEDGRDDLVALPLLYGVSWQTNKDFDHDGSFTRFICPMPGTKLNASGIGVGHQDFTVVERERRPLFGLGSLEQIVVPLDMSDPRFDEKCRARGIDPDEVRRQMS